jgi:hypothetical protein
MISCANSKTRPGSDLWSLPEGLLHGSDLRTLPEGLLDVSILRTADGLQKLGATKRDKLERGLNHNELNEILKSTVL